MLLEDDRFPEDWRLAAKRFADKSKRFQSKCPSFEWIDCDMRQKRRNCLLNQLHKTQTNQLFNQISKSNHPSNIWLAIILIAVDRPKFSGTSSYSITEIDMCLQSKCREKVEISRMVRSCITWPVHRKCPINELNMMNAAQKSQF